MPYEDPSNAEYFKPLGPPLKPVVKEGGTGTLKPTPTPGVYENTKTGKLETDIQENKRVGLADPQFQNKILRRTEPGAFQCKSSPTKVKITSESSPVKLSSDPQPSGKSSIAEISLQSGLRIRYSPSCQEMPKLVLGSGLEEIQWPGVNLYFSKVPEYVRDAWLQHVQAGRALRVWWFVNPVAGHVYFKDRQDNWFLFNYPI